jgi:hypothetical protein
MTTNLLHLVHAEAIREDRIRIARRRRRAI